VGVRGPYRGQLIRAATVDGIRAVSRDYEIMLITILTAMLDRFERDPEYPFIDTKLNILTGEDHPQPSDPDTDIRGKDTIYGTIQGRGLEALVGHIKWLPHCTVLSADALVDMTQRLTAMVSSVFRQMEKLRAKNRGSVPDLMTPKGRAFTIGSNGSREFISTVGDRPTLADLFYAKAMLAAALFLGERDKVPEAEDLLRRVANDLCGSWPGGQLVERGQAKPPLISGMIAIGDFTLFADLLGKDEWYDWGEVFIRHVLDVHVNLGQFDNLQMYDHTEYVDPQGQPWLDDEKRILLDPGHCIEFVGLAAKFLLLDRNDDRTAADRERMLERCISVLPQVLLQSYALGYNRHAGGIHKSVDLLTGQPINSDMPWWNLPETMRAAAELLLLLPPSSELREPLCQVICDCSNAFVSNFVNRNVHLMAYQTVDCSGRPVDVIPLTSDLDPGYHTGLCIIDFLHCIENLAETA